MAKNRFNSILDTIERVGNKLPHPATLFFLMAALVAVISAIGAGFELSAIHPATGETIEARNLLSAEGFRWIYTNMEHNFVKFPPLGLVLVIMIGIGVAEGSGLFTVMVKQLVLGAPKSLVTYAVIIAGLSTSAAQIIDPNMYINPLVNYFFMVVSAVMITFVGGWVTEKVVEPRLGKYNGNAEALRVEGISDLERKGLKWAGIATLLFIVVMAMTIIPENGLLRDPQTGGILRSPFFSGIVVGLMLLFFIPGLVYGIIVGTIKSDKDVIKHMTASMKGLASYIVLVFFAAQFIYWFNYSNLGLILAINGAEFLKSVGFTGLPLIICFILLSAFLNLFMGSASAKWAILAPVFIPMFMLLDFHPGLTQASFRVGDSVTNVITPMMSYFALIVTYAQRYDEKYGIGTIISLMIPYTLIFLLAWIVIITIWVIAGFPLGFDGPLYLK